MIRDAPLAFSERPGVRVHKVKREQTHSFRPHQLPLDFIFLLQKDSISTFVLHWFSRGKEVLLRMDFSCEKSHLFLRNN